MSICRNVTAALVGGATAAHGITFDAGEVDIRVRYGAGAWEWSAYAHESEESFTLGETLFRGNEEAERPVPGDPRYTFLGSSGQSVWVLPTPQEPDLIFLGLSAEENGSGIFQNDLLRLTLLSVTGPGEFALFSVNSFREPLVHMNTRDGLSSVDFISLPTGGGHLHANWAFSAPGDYLLTVVPTGTLASSGEMVSGPAVEWRFTVVPEPGSAAMLAVGCALLGAARRRKRAGSIRA